MIDGEGSNEGSGAEGAQGVAAAEGQGGGAAQGAEGEQGSQPPEWLGALPDELKSDATLGRFKDVEALARGHIETQKLARSKLAIPGEGASEDDWGKVWDALGRPESADKYDVPMPELPVDASDEVRAALAQEYQPFRELAHRLGLNVAQAKGLGQFELDRQDAFFNKGAAEVGELKTKLGADYEPKRAAAQKVFTQIFGDDAEAIRFADELDRKVGSARVLKGMMRLAEIAGEHGIVENDNVEGFGEVPDANAKLNQLQADESWRDKFNKGDPLVVAQRNRLLELAQRQAMRGGRATA